MSDQRSTRSVYGWVKADRYMLPRKIDVTTALADRHRLPSTSALESWLRAVDLLGPDSHQGGEGE